MGLHKRLLFTLLVLLLHQHIVAGCPEPCRCKENAEALCRNKSLTVIPACSDCGNITFLDMSHNNIRELSDVSFKDYPKLTRLLLNYNDIQTIDSQAFRQLIHLKETEMVKNNLTQIDENSFSFLYSLSSLSFRDNPIVISSPFLSSDSLTTLILSGCQLKNIPNDTFALLPALENILLDNNELTELPFNIFEPLANLEKVYLQGNPWRCEGYLEQLMKTKPDMIGDLKMIKCLPSDEKTIVRSSEEQLPVFTYTEIGRDMDIGPSDSEDLLHSKVFSGYGEVFVYMYGVMFGILLITCIIAVVILRETITVCFHKLHYGISSVDLRRSDVDYEERSGRSSLEPRALLNV